MTNPFDVRFESREMSADDVAVSVPTVKFPTDELDTIEPADSKSGDEVAL